MKAEDIQVGKYYYFKCAYGVETGRCLGKGDEEAVMEMRKPYDVPFRRVICEAEPPKPKNPPVNPFAGKQWRTETPPEGSIWYWIKSLF